MLTLFLRTVGGRSKYANAGVKQRQRVGVGSTQYLKNTPFTYKKRNNSAGFDIEFNKYMPI